MPHPSCNDSYASGQPLPWGTGTPYPMLIEMIEVHDIAPGRTLEVGCGTGTNAIYPAQRGFEAVGVDISPLAVKHDRTVTDICFDAGLQQCRQLQPDLPRHRRRSAERFPSAWAHAGGPGRAS